MSSTTTESPPKNFSDRAIPLLKEYFEKLVVMSAEARKVRAAARRGFPLETPESLILRERFKSLKPAATSLARHVSQRLEHGTLDEMDKLELSLRLAEFEHALLSAEAVFADASRK